MCLNIPFLKNINNNENVNYYSFLLQGSKENMILYNEKQTESFVNIYIFSWIRIFQ